MPSSIGEIIYIEDLNLQGNKLTILPFTFHQLKSLNTLYLNSNKELDNYISHHLCNTATRMKSLRNLYLDKEQMKIVPCDLRLQSDKRKKIIKLYR